MALACPSLGRLPWIDAWDKGLALAPKAFMIDGEGLFFLPQLCYSSESRDWPGMERVRW